MKSNICLICKRVISDHSRRENIECAINLCNVNEAVDPCGIDGQLDQKPARSYPKEDSNVY